MELQELLDDTNKLVSKISIQHRNTLNTDYNLHFVLGDIKDFLNDFIDTIGEDLVISGEITRFSSIRVDGTDDCKQNYEDSLIEIEDYLFNLQDFYKNTDDLEIQNEYMGKSKELRKLYNKLKSTYKEDEEEEQKQEIKQPIKSKIKTIPKMFG